MSALFQHGHEARRPMAAPTSANYVRSVIREIAADPFLGAGIKARDVMEHFKLRQATAYRVVRIVRAKALKALKAVRS